MPEDYRTEVLNQFVLPNPTPTEIVNTTLIHADVPARQDLLDYHPRTGASYSIVTAIEGSGSDSYLSIIPQAQPGAGWSKAQRDLIQQLKFIPVPDVPIPGRKPVLLMMRSGTGNIRLANTPWYLVYARIEKTAIADRMLNDVILVWEYRDPANKTTYLKPISTCWKW